MITQEALELSYPLHAPYAELPFRDQRIRLRQMSGEIAQVIQEGPLPVEEVKARARKSLSDKHEYTFYTEDFDYGLAYGQVMGVFTLKRDRKVYFSKPE